MDNILTVKDKILAFLVKKGIKKGDFFEITGIQSSNFKGKNMQSQPGGDMLVKILTTYPELSAEWLLRGEGDMLRTADTAPANAIVQAPVPPQFDALISKITQQAEEIGRLKARIAELERRRGDNAPDAQSDNVAHAG